MPERQSVTWLDLVVAFLIVMFGLFVIGWNHQSQLYNLQRRIAVLEQRLSK